MSCAPFFLRLVAACAMDKRERSLPCVILVVGVVLLVEDKNIYERLGYVQEQTPIVVDEDGRRDQEVDGAYTAAAHGGLDILNNAFEPPPEAPRRKKSNNDPVI